MGNVSINEDLAKTRGGTSKTPAEEKVANTLRARVIFDAVNSKKKITVLVDKKKKKYEDIDLKWVQGKKQVWTNVMEAAEADWYGINKKVKDGHFSVFSRVKFWTDGTKEYGVTDLFKSEEFGGGKGSGGGADNTARTESLQCYYLSLLYNGPSSIVQRFKDCAAADKNNKSGQYIVNPISKKELTSTAKYCDTNVNLNDAWKDGPKDWRYIEIKHGKDKESTWFNWANNVYVRTALAIYNSDNGKKFQGKTVYCHRGSKFMDKVYHQKKKCVDHDTKHMGESGKRIAPANYSNDKWNPGDIWISSLDKNACPFPGKIYEGTKGEDTCDWAALKNAVYAAADDGITLGISLKKVMDKGHVDRFNLQKRKQNKTIKWVGFSFGQTGDFFNSADIYIYFSGGREMQFRATGTTKLWQGEIKGAAAAGGKIGGGGTNYYVEKYYGKAIGKNGPSNGKWKETRWDDSYLKKLYTLYKYFNKKQHGVGKIPLTHPNINNFEKLCNAYKNPSGKPSAEAFKFGKYMSLLFLDSIWTDIGKASEQGWAEDTYRYAQSNIEYSSFFIKVS